MGWWRATEEGVSLQVDDTGIVWGDGPADIMDNALDKIDKEFLEAYGRKPSKVELRAGLRFSLGGREDDDGVT